MKKNENVMEENVNQIIENAMQQLKNVIEVNTVVGKPITLPENITLIPISKINVGFVAGGGEVKCNLKKIKSNAYPFTGGSGSGFTITPVGFVSIKNDEINYLNVDTTPPYKEIFNLTDKIVNKIINDKGDNNE